MYSHHHRRARKSGFTLVEILIVVIILGILAAIVIPQFTNASTSAKTNSVISQLQTLRSQIQLYKLQHNDTYPDLTTAQWSGLMSKTDISGAVSASGAYGPYLESLPRNPLNGNSKVILSNGTLDAATGWLYNPSTGDVTATNQSAATRTFDENNPVLQ